MEDLEDMDLAGIVAAAIAEWSTSAVLDRCGRTQHLWLGRSCCSLIEGHQRPGTMHMVTEMHDQVVTRRDRHHSRPWSPWG